MKIMCPKCKHPCGLFQNACPSCGFSLTLGAVVGHYWSELKALAAFRCPACSQAVPVGQAACAHCGTAMTVGAAVDHTLAPPKRWWYRFLRRATPGQKRLIQWIYLLLSALLLWATVAHIDNNVGSAWFSYAALSAVYIAVFGLLLLLLVPRPVIQRIYFHSSALTKLSVLCNALVGAFALQLFIGAWWARAIILATLFGVLWLAAYIFHVWIMPMAAATEQTFVGNPRDNFDPRARQGRDVRLD